MMKLCQFKVNNAWAFVFGKGDGWTKFNVWARTARPLALHGFPLFFQTRAEAVAAAESLGLVVAPKTGLVTTKPLNNPGRSHSKACQKLGSNATNSEVYRVCPLCRARLISEGWKPKTLKNPADDDRSFFGGGVTKNWREVESFASHTEAIYYARQLSKREKIAARDIIVFRDSHTTHRSHVFVHNSAIKPKKNPGASAQDKRDAARSAKFVREHRCLYCGCSWATHKAGGFLKQCTTCGPSNSPHSQGCYAWGPVENKDAPKPKAGLKVPFEAPDRKRVEWLKTGIIE